MRTLVGLLLALVLAVPAAAQTGRVSAGNSTTAVLGSGATFTGAWDDATQAAVVVVTIKADQASATNGVKVEFSSDCVNQDYVTTHSFTDTVNGQTFADAMAAKCVRIEFVNGASGQASFRLQTVVRDNGYGGTSSGGGVAGSVTINDPTITTQKLAINASGQASMTCANCSGTGASAVDRATFTPGTNSIAPSGGLYDDTPPTDLTAGMAGIVRMTPKRAFHVQLRNQAGTEVGTSTTPLQVTGANGTFPVTGTFFQATQPVSIAAAVDVSDRAGRLVGVVYGSQAQQLKQTATNFNLQSELAVGGTLIDPRDVSDRSGRALGSIANLFVLDTTVTGRLPAGASPANGETNTNTNLSRIGGYTFVFNGATWDRWTGAISGTVTTTPPANASTNISQFGGSTVTLGQQLAAASLPVILPAATVTTLTPPAAITGFALEAGHLATIDTSAAATNTNTAPLVTAAAGGYVRQDSTATIAKESGGNLAGAKTDLDAIVTNTTSIATAANQTTGNASLASIVTNTTGAAKDSSLSTLDADLLASLKTNGGQTSLLELILRALVQQGAPKNAAAIRGSFGRTVTSTGDALDVNPKFPAPSYDPCMGPNKQKLAVSQTASTRLLQAPAGTFFLCSAVLNGADAENLSLVAGTGATCGTATEALVGSTTAANGMNLLAGAGFALPPGGWWTSNSVAGNDICLLQSGAGRVAGVITYALK